MCWWLFYWQLIRQQNRNEPLPTLKGAAGFTVAFLFWFMAPTRLGGYPDVQDALLAGKAPLHQCALRGVASLRPGAYYSIRITTLVIFIVWMVRFHFGFFNNVWTSFV